MNNSVQPLTRAPISIGNSGGLMSRVEGGQKGPMGIPMLDKVEISEESFMGVDLSNGTADLLENLCKNLDRPEVSAKPENRESVEICKNFRSARERQGVTGGGLKGAGESKSGKGN